MIGLRAIRMPPSRARDSHARAKPEIGMEDVLPEGVQRRLSDKKPL